MLLLGDCKLCTNVCSQVIFNLLQDRPLPHLVRGHAYRVVGTWDTKHRYLKCVSVRQSQPSEEEQWIRLAIQASDRAMRQLAATQNEQ